MSLDGSHRDSIEGRLKVLADDWLNRERALSDDYDRLWEKETVVRGRLTVPERVRFRLLHQQFFADGVPGLSRAVQAARFLWKGLQRKEPRP